MANDIFGGLMKGLSDLIPQDDPNIKAVTSMAEVKSLKNRESELYEEIGKRAVEDGAAESYPELLDRLRVVKGEIAEAEGKARQASEAKAAAEAKAAQEAEMASQIQCPDCGFRNPEGTKFCQECGSKLTASDPVFCTSCGAENPPESKFCGFCGGKI